MAGKLHGTMHSDRGNFGFIQQDNGYEDMFVMPVQCESFGGALPPLGTRVVFDVVLDPKSGRPRAENVAPEAEMLTLAAPDLGAHDLGQESVASGDGAWRWGTMLSENGKFGFIQQDNGEADMFVLPLQCEGFGGNFPPIGERVAYTVGIDGKTGRPRAENVVPEGTDLTAIRPQPPAARQTSAVRQFPAIRQLPAVQQSYPSGVQVGMVLNNRGKYAFVRPDAGGEDIFLMPAQCIGFGGSIPIEGTRVCFMVGIDKQKGLPTAEDVKPESAAPALQLPPARHLPSWAPAGPPTWQPSPAPSWQPPAWQPAPAWHAAAPAVWQPDPWTQPVAGGQLAGTMLKTNGKFGFIQQDNGQEDMFVMPIQCQAFGGELPPIGARVVYDIAVDQKTGRPRAENVEPEGQWAGSWGGKAKGKSKGAAHFSRPY